MSIMGKILILSAYGVYGAFWVRFVLHLLVWWRATRRMEEPKASAPFTVKACARASVDMVFFGRLFMVNPALWLGEWLFHVTFLLVILRHLRFFLDPVPEWVWAMQTPGLIAGYFLPAFLVYILAVRLLTKRERYASPANVFLLALVLVIGSLGLLMHAFFTPNLVDAKLFIYGLVHFKLTPPPESLWFAAHFLLALVLVAFIPTHAVTAPLVMLAARKREQGLRWVLHEK